MDITQYKTVAEAAKILKRTRFAVAKMCQRGVFPNAQKRGRAWFIPADEVPLGKNLKRGVKKSPANL